MQARTTADYPRFSSDEMSARRAALLDAMSARGVDHLVVYGMERSGSGVQWLTGWPTTREAAAVVSPGVPDVLLVQHHNHLPNARRVAPDLDVRWGGPATTTTLRDVLAERGAGSGSVGFVGPVGYRLHAELASLAPEPVDMNADYTRLRLIKSDEEIEWLRRGASMSDAAVTALLEHASAGHSEAELADIIERAYVPLGGTTHIHYLAVTSMSEPDRGVPSQYLGTRELHEGDALTVEISAAWWGYAGQVLRTFAVGSEPSELYRRLHDVAEAAFEAVATSIRPGVHVREAVAAASIIEESGFTIIDDLVHGFGGGYLPPVLRSRSGPQRPVPDMEFEAGMTVVIQPNVVTPDGRAGVQTGELMLVTDGGMRSLHEAPRGFLRLGTS